MWASAETFGPSSLRALVIILAFVKHWAFHAVLRQRFPKQSVASFWNALVYLLSASVVTLGVMKSLNPASSSASIASVTGSQCTSMNFPRRISWFRNAQSRRTMMLSNTSSASAASLVTMQILFIRGHPQLLQLRLPDQHRHCHRCLLSPRQHRDHMRHRASSQPGVLRA